MYQDVFDHYRGSILKATDQGNAGAAAIYARLAARAARHLQLALIEQVRAWAVKHYDEGNIALRLSDADLLQVLGDAHTLQDAIERIKAGGY